MDELIKCLATGSTGNCYLVNLGSGNFLLDLGISVDRIVSKVNLNSVDFAFVSHMHKDHSKSMEKIHSRGIPVLLGYKAKDLDMIPLKDEYSRKYTLYTFPVIHGECPNGGLIVYDWSKGFDNKEVLLYVTDFSVCKYDLKLFPFTRVMVECNYNDDLMPEPDENGEIDFKLKRQINTHMSLEGCISFLKTLDLSNCKEIYLIHRSPTMGDSISMGSKVYSKFNIPTGVCQQHGGIDWYGRSEMD